MQDLKILCLGDSYTIGELLPESDNFPHQLCALLENKNYCVQELTVIAKTGDTTFELSDKIAEQKPHSNYDYVTLLIGVNNQYRNLLVQDYAIEFEALLLQAIGFANNINQHVIVLSIPDWGLTPFNTLREPLETSKAIDAFNAVNKELALKYACKYIDVTQSTRAHAKDTHYLATDLLHYSAHEYAIWAQWVADIIG